MTTINGMQAVTFDGDDYFEGPTTVSGLQGSSNRTPIKGQYIGFLDDLFVEPEFRGQKIAQKLISHLKSLSKANNWGGIRWITHSS